MLGEEEFSGVCDKCRECVLAGREDEPDWRCAYHYDLAQCQADDESDHVYSAAHQEGRL